jgi:hypothetical protein
VTTTLPRLSPYAVRASPSWSNENVWLTVTRSRPAAALNSRSVNLWPLGTSGGRHHVDVGTPDIRRCGVEHRGQYAARAHHSGRGHLIASGVQRLVDAAGTENLMTLEYDEIDMASGAVMPAKPTRADTPQQIGECGWVVGGTCGPRAMVSADRCERCSGLLGQAAGLQRLWALPVDLRGVTRCSRPRPQALHRWRAFGCRQVDQDG